MEKKLEALREYLGRLGSCVIALSGGQDSAFLLDVAREVLGSEAVAVTAFTPYTLKRDLRQVREIVAELQVDHRTIDIPLPDGLRYNPKDRCYICKSTMLFLVRNEALSRGIDPVLDGTNSDDRETSRPGMRALREQEVLSPLRDCGFTRTDIRESLRQRGRKAWIRQADSCLLTRLPMGHKVALQVLARIEMAEEYLLTEGIMPVRVRSDGTTARIETAREMRKNFCDEDCMDRIAKQLKEFGFRYVVLDLEGYRSGSMDFSEGGQNDAR